MTDIMIPTDYADIPCDELVAALDVATAATAGSIEHTEKIKAIENGRIQHARVLDTEAAADAIQAGKPYPGTVNEDTLRNELDDLKRQVGAHQLHYERCKEEVLAVHLKHRRATLASLADMGARADADVLDLLDQLGLALDRRSHTAYLASWASDDLARRGRKTPQLPQIAQQGVAAIRDYVAATKQSGGAAIIEPVAS